MLQAPHRHIAVNSEKERFVLKLFDNLWERYRGRVIHVQRYEKMIRDHGGNFVNDHIAFRTIASQHPATGISTLSRLFQALGYAPKACYEFPDKHMASIHMAHPNANFPKLFITELKTWELSEPARRIITGTLKSHRPAFPDAGLAKLRNADENSSKENTLLLKSLIRLFNELPWKLPRKRDVIELEKETQFGAWVLLNGYEVNHFTASVNSHGVDGLNDIEKTVDALKKAGVPMKKEIEGERGSLLRQSSTESVVLPFWVKGKDRKEKLNWTYAYFEIAQRGFFTNPQTGRSERFEGFLGAQATHLFDMTKRR